MKKSFKMLAMMMLTLIIIQGASFAQANKDIVDTAASDKQFSTLVQAIQAAGLVDELKGQGPFTVFAPTNDAFNKLPAGTVENLLKVENKEMLIDILTYHVVPNALDAKALSALDGKTLQMADGKDTKIQVKDGKLFINNAQVITKDIKTKNGIIHVIDTVLIPHS